jgi:hypothetical protein
MPKTTQLNISEMKNSLNYLGPQKLGSRHVTCERMAQTIVEKEAVFVKAHYLNSFILPYLK